MIAPAVTVAFVAGIIFAPAARGRDGNHRQLRTLERLIENVPTSTASRYGVHDSAGNSMDTLKIIERVGGGYLGVYHTQINGAFVVKLATSEDLLNWTYKIDLAVHGSQPTLARLSSGGYLLAYEADTGCSGGSCLRFLEYRSEAALLTATASRTYRAARTLSKCAEGTPNIYETTVSPGIEHSTINVGFHYFRNCDVDRQATGVLKNFSSWSARRARALDSAIERFGIRGNIGDRDSLTFNGRRYTIIEAQLRKHDTRSWRVFLVDARTDVTRKLNIRTSRRSVSFANPTLSVLNLHGRRALVVTLFVFRRGAGRGETGELVYYRMLPR